MAGDRTAVQAVVLAALLAVALVASPSQAQLSGIICTTKCGAELAVCLTRCPREQPQQQQQQQEEDSVSGTLCNAGCIVAYNLCTAQCPKK